MLVSIHPLRVEDAPAIVDAEDDRTVRWLSGGRSTIEGTAAYVVRLASDAADGKGKRAFGIWLDGQCVGTVDYDPGGVEGCEPGDVNIAYGVAPWARGRGLAAQAVTLVCERLRDQGIGRRAIIRVDERNPASARVAEKAGFAPLRDMQVTAEKPGEQGPITLRVFWRALSPREHR
jgi:RimJ/RimL family protein N-acetyltransferase